ncbi:aminopeptidase Ey [Oryzias melastigma]|uniref:aminopeptidase Ey n=1 Tax=Oryzias melastigma TaxID=30732 RepID=UPI00168D86DB|nr:aminopeptidase Ey [Oryzias melastigma]
MGNALHVRKRVALASLVTAVVVIVVIIALSVSLTQEKSRNAGMAEPTVSAPDHYRLPDTITPISYNVTFWPRLEPDDNDLYLFTGNCTVVFKCTRETDLILIHSIELNFTLLDGFHARLTGLNGPAPSLKKTWLEDRTEYLVVQLDGPLQVNSSYELFTEFVGELSLTQQGFYRSVYTEDGVEKVIATTQMQPTHARKAFPCFDEPALKAVFHVTLIHPQNTTALSNSLASDKGGHTNPGREQSSRLGFIGFGFRQCPLCPPPSPLYSSRVTPRGCTTSHVNFTLDGQDLIRTSFEPTKIMSTYLLAFVVCDFGHIKTETGSSVLIRVWANKKAIDKGKGNYALEKATPILAFYEKYYNISYPLKKSDQIAIPGFVFPAMENWGLITYRESTFLQDLHESFYEDKEMLVDMVSHELAHMWFGNLVTLRWWNDLWLNEGFASYVSNLGSDHAEPTWELNDFSASEKILVALDVDASCMSHPLSLKEEEVQTPRKIASLFDSITYKKGTAVLRMLSNFVTEAVLTKGLQTYLKEFQYKNTVPKDLWKHLQMAVDEAGISLPRPVEEIMNRWVLQMGFPLITIDTRTGTVHQKHYLSSSECVMDTPSEFNYSWFVPITWMKNGKEEPKYWLLTKEDTNTDMALGSSDWLVANINLTSFFRVNYDAENWERIINKLNSRHQDIPLINRAQIIDDAFNLAELGMVNMTLALRITSYLDKEVEYMPWRRADFYLKKFLDILLPRGIHGPLQAYFRKKVTPVFQYYKKLTRNWTERPTRPSDLYNQVTVINLACKVELKDCTQLATTWFREWMNNSPTNKIPPSLEKEVYCSAVAAGGTEEWDFIWSMYQKNVMSEQTSYSLMYALSCTRQPWLISRYLEYCLDPEQVPVNDIHHVITFLAHNPVSQPFLLYFLRTNWQDIVNKSFFSKESVIYIITSLMSTRLQLNQFLQFKEELKKQLSLGEEEFEVFNTVEANMKWIERYSKEVHDWLISETSEK